MDRKLNTVNFAPAANNNSLRTWTKPEATAAEVAKATLGAGGPTPNEQDHQNCAS